MRNTSIRRSKIAVLAVDERLTRIAGRIKCTYKGMLSLADAYTLAAAKMHDATLITTDPQLADLKLVHTRLLREAARSKIRHILEANAPTHAYAAEDGLSS
ncbi:MAG: PIN domain-containing protein [Candidatus Bathyarchaeia archaeon]